jgi:hypothetical protein
MPTDCLITFGLNNGVYSHSMTPGEVGVSAGASASSCWVSGVLCSANASANANGSDAWQVAAGSVAIAENGATAGATSNANSTGGIVADASAVGIALTPDSIANAKANANNLFGAVAGAGAVAEAASPGYAGASANAITIGGAALSSSTSNNAIDPSGLDGQGEPIKGFALSKSQGCSINGSCGSALAVSAAGNGTGFAGTITNSYALSGSQIGSVADAQASGELAATPTQSNINFQVSPDGWTHSFTANSGSSTAGTVVDLVP